MGCAIQEVICIKHPEILFAICHPSLGFHFITFTAGGEQEAERTR